MKNLNRFQTTSGLENTMENYFQTDVEVDTEFSSPPDLTLLITTGHFGSVHLKKLTKYPYKP